MPAPGSEGRTGTRSLRRELYFPRVTRALRIGPLSQDSDRSAGHDPRRRVTPLLQWGAPASFAEDSGLGISPLTSAGGGAHSCSAAEPVGPGHRRTVLAGPGRPPPGWTCGLHPRLRHGGIPGSGARRSGRARPLSSSSTWGSCCRCRLARRRPLCARRPPHRRRRLSHRGRVTWPVPRPRRRRPEERNGAAREVMEYATQRHGHARSRGCASGMRFRPGLPGLSTSGSSTGPRLGGDRPGPSELGVNFIDTANVYARRDEEFIGQSLKNLGVNREDVVPASKVCASTRAPVAPGHRARITAPSGGDHLGATSSTLRDYDTPSRRPWRPSMRWCGAAASAIREQARCTTSCTMQVVADGHGWTGSRPCRTYNLLYREDEREMIRVPPVKCAAAPHTTARSPPVTSRPDGTRGRRRIFTDVTMRSRVRPQREADLPIEAAHEKQTKDSCA